MHHLELKFSCHLSIQNIPPSFDVQLLSDLFHLLPKQSGAYLVRNPNSPVQVAFFLQFFFVLIAILLAIDLPFSLEIPILISSVQLSKRRFFFFW